MVPLLFCWSFRLAGENKSGGRDIKNVRAHQRSSTPMVPNDKRNSGYSGSDKLSESSVPSSRQSQDARQIVSEQLDHFVLAFGALRDRLLCTESAARLERSNVFCARPYATRSNSPGVWEVGGTSGKSARVTHKWSFSARRKAFSTELHTKYIPICSLV